MQFLYKGTDVTGSPNPFLDTANWQSINVDDEPTPMSSNIAGSGGTFNKIKEEVLNIDRVAYLESRCGEEKSTITKTAIPIADLLSGYAVGDLGTQINIGSSDDYYHTIIQCNAGEKYDVRMKRTVSTSKISKYAYVLDANNIIIGIYCSSRPQSGSEVLEDTFIIPEGGVKMYIDVYQANIITINKHNIVSLQSQIDSNKNDIEDIKDDISSIEGNVDYIEDSIGDLETEYKNVSITLVSGGVKNTSNKATIAATDYYDHIVLPCSNGDSFKVTTKIGTSNNYPYYCYVTNESDTILESFIAKSSSGNVVVEADIVVSNPNAAKLYLQEYHNLTGHYITVKKLQVKPISESISEIENDINDINESIDNISKHVFTEKNIGTIYFDTVIQKSIAETNAKSNKLLNFCLITDTHVDGGERGAGVIDGRKTNDLFKYCCNNSIFRFGLHCGDLITDYGLTEEQCLTAFDTSLEVYDGIKIPLYITKGNHDYNSDTETKEERVADVTFFNKVVSPYLDEDVVFDAEQPTGCYYYKDFDDVKIRLVVLNDYVISSTSNKTVSRNFQGKQATWITNYALNLESKDVPSNWAVILVSHETFHEKELINSIVSAFLNGTSVGVEGTDAYYHDFSNQGSGHLVAHLHGHNHQDTYTNSDGYNDVGFNSGITSSSFEGSYKEYCVSSICVDPVAKKIYDIRLGRGSNREWSYV